MDSVYKRLLEHSREYVVAAISELRRIEFGRLDTEDRKKVVVALGHLNTLYNLELVPDKLEDRALERVISFGDGRQ